MYLCSTQQLSASALRKNVVQDKIVRWVWLLTLCGAEHRSERNINSHLLSCMISSDVTSYSSTEDKCSNGATASICSSCMQRFQVMSGLFWHLIYTPVVWIVQIRNHQIMNYWLGKINVGHRQIKLSPGSWQPSQTPSSPTPNLQSPIKHQA